MGEIIKKDLAFNSNNSMERIPDTHLKIGGMKRKADRFMDGGSSINADCTSCVQNSNRRLSPSSDSSKTPKLMSLNDNNGPINTSFDQDVNSTTHVSITTNEEECSEEGRRIHYNDQSSVCPKITDLTFDTQLAEELACCSSYHSQCSEEEGVETNPVSPVPLLTPPASPIHYHSQSDDDDSNIICEWPSNLVIDNALTAISELRPPSLSEVLECCNEPLFVASSSSSLLQ